MNSPFAFVGNSSLKKNFIGRNKIIETIKNRIMNDCEMMSIVGLPRIGKTSLIWHMFLEEKKPEWWFSNHRTIPIYSDISKQPTAKNLWGVIALNIRYALERLKKISCNNIEKLNSIINNLSMITTMEDAADRHNSLENSLKDIKDLFGFKFVFIFDELDYLWKYNYTQDQFNQVRSISIYGPVITCSRRKPSHIERMAFKSNYFDNKIFENIWVTPFDSEETEEYWQHFKPFFSKLEEDDFENYKKLVENYTGNHPHMMNIMNNEAIESGNLTKWPQSNNSKDRYESERKFRFSLEKAFKKQMGYVREQQLEDASIKLVLEGVNLPSGEDVNDLLNYGFIRIVPSEIKKEIFGYDMGPTIDSGKFRFICMSDFFSHLMKEEYEPTITGIQLLKTTEKKLQAFVKELLKREFGPNCLESEADESSSDYKEKWELYFEPKENEWVEGEMSKEDLELHKKEIDAWKRAIDSWKSRRNSRLKRVSNGCKPLSERQPIDTLSSFDIGSLIYVFFDKKKPWNDDASKYAKEWRNDLEKWGLLRNAELHFYVEEKTNEFICKAEKSCHRICKDIDDWIRSQQGKLL